MSARKGKIARLPHKLRSQVNNRLLDGQTAGTLLAWLNALPQTKAVLQEHFHGDAITPQNLSEWRHGGYQDWLAEHEQVEKLKRLSEFAYDLAEAGGGTLAEGSAAVVGGKILERIETATEEDIESLVDAIVALRAGDTANRRLDLAELRARQKDRELALHEKRFRRETCELFIEWAEDERAREIANAPEIGVEAKVEQLGKLIFQEDW